MPIAAGHDRVGWVAAIATRGAVLRARGAVLTVRNAVWFSFRFGSVLLEAVGTIDHRG